MTGSCVTIGEGTCLRCANGMSADSTGICKRRALFGMTHSVRRELVTCAVEATFCTACDAERGMFLSNGKCYTNDDFVGTCSFPRRRAGVRSATQGPSGASGRAVRAWTLVASEKTAVVVDGTVTVQSVGFFSLTGTGVTTVRVSGAC